MGKETNEKATLTLSDTTGIGEVMDDIRSLLDNAGLTYHETANPESCEKPHMIVPMLDAQTNKVTAVCCLFVSARMENGDSDSINIAKILNRQRDSLMAAGLHENVRIVGIACLPNLSADKHALHHLNQVSDYTLYKEDFEEFQNDPSLFAAKLEKCVAKDAEKLAERCPYLKQPEGMDEDDLNTTLDDYYKCEIALSGKSGEQYVNDMLRRLPGAVCFMSPFCIDDSNVCDHLLLDKNGFVIVETKNWHNIQSVSKSKVELAEGVVRPNPDKQLQRYKERLTAELLRIYPYYSADYIRQHIRSVLWLPRVERSPEVEEAFDTPVIFRGEGENPTILKEKLDSLFTEGEPLSGAAYQDFRRKLEPSYTPCLPVEGDYSELRVWDADEFTPEDARRSVMSWMRGTKQVHFFRSHKDLEVLRRQLSDSMAERNISVSPENPFELCFRKGSETAPGAAIGNEKYMQLFRMEAYVLPVGDYQKMHIINGTMTNAQKAELLAIQNRQIELLAKGIDSGVYSFEQYAAEHGQGGFHTAVRAGAGTGKTYLLTAKFSFLLYSCSKSLITNLIDQVVMLTFTNEAADNMRKRIKGMLFSFFVLTGNPVFTRCIEELSRMQICTIDAFCERLIQENPIPLGVGSDCSVTTSTYQYRQILDEAIARHFPEDLDHAYPNALGEDSYAALVEIINGCLAKYASDEPYLHDWESLCRETSNTGNATSMLKILYELFALTQPWKNYSRQDEKERYITNFKKLFEEIAEAFCHQQMTLDSLYETLKLQILTHQQKESAAIERQSDAVKCMTIHKSKGLEFGTVFLFTGNTTDWAGNDTLCTVRRMENGMSEVGFRMQLQPIGSTETQTIATPHFTAAADADEEWRVLYVALTRAKNNLIVSYIDRQDAKQNPWNTVLRRINSN